MGKVERRGRPRKFTGEVVKALATVVDAGMTLDEVANICNVSVTAVRNPLLRANYKFHPRGPRKGIRRDGKKQTRAAYRGIGFGPVKVGDTWVLRTPTGFSEYESRTAARKGVADLPVSPQDAARALAKVKAAS